MTATADPLAVAMSEDNLLTSVLDMCKVLGLRTAHFRPARTEKGWRTAVSGDGKGFPDLVILGNRLIMRELKAGRGYSSAEQRIWLNALFAAGVDATIWRPSDWRSGRIERELRELTDGGGAS